MSRTPTPGSVPAAPLASHGPGHPTLPATVEPVSLVRLLTEWRLNLIVVAVLGVAAAAYLAGVRRLCGRATAGAAAGDGGVTGPGTAAWPAHHTAAFLAGLTVALVALCGGVGTYAPALMSVQLVQFLLVLLVVPALLLGGAPLTLLLRVRALDGERAVPPVLRSRVLRTLTDPLTVMLLVGALVFALYRSPLLELALRSTGFFLLVNTAALAVGLLLLWPALGADPLPQPRGAVERIAPLLATTATLSILAAQLRYGDQVLAGHWFGELDWPWADEAADQRLGALVVAAGVVLLLVLTLPAAHAHAPALPPEPDQPGAHVPGPGSAARPPADASRAPAPPAR
jgi:cytochrome c oxidase assembly factor CtaG